MVHSRQASVGGVLPGPGLCPDNVETQSLITVGDMSVRAKAAGSAEALVIKQQLTSTMQRPPYLLAGSTR